MLRLCPRGFFIAAPTTVERLAKVVQAKDGVIQAPFEVVGDHIKVHDNTHDCFDWKASDVKCGKASYRILAASSTTLSFSAEIMAPSNGDDSFWVWLDDAAPWAWRTPEHKTFKWARIEKQKDTKFSKRVVAGLHTLHIGNREDGSQLRALRIDSGDASFVVGKASVCVVRAQLGVNHALHTCTIVSGRWHARARTHGL